MTARLRKSLHPQLVRWPFHDQGDQNPSCQVRWRGSL